MQNIERDKTLLQRTDFMYLSNLEVLPVYEMYVFKTNQTRMNGQLSRHKGQNIHLKLQSVSSFHTLIEYMYSSLNNGLEL